MPAVQVERLAMQVEELEKSFEDPARFIRLLHKTMNYYADRTFRSGNTVSIRPVLSTYQIPPTILRHLIQHLSTKAQKIGRPTLAICDALWQEQIIEFHAIATHLLGQIPLAFSSVILQRVNDWAPGCRDTDVLMDLFYVSLAGVRKNEVTAYLDLITKWINSSDVYLQRIACLALLPLVEDQNFENFPAIYSLLTPIARLMPQELSTEIADVVRILIRRSPSETLYFLRQVLLTSKNRKPEILIRFLLPDLPPQQQATLRSIMRED